MSRPVGSTRSYLERGRSQRPPLDDPKDLLHGLIPFVQAADRAIREFARPMWPAALQATRERALKEHNPVFADYADWALRERLYRGKDVEESQDLGRMGGRAGAATRWPTPRGAS